MEGTEVDRWTAGLGSASHGARAIDSGAKVVFFASTIVATGGEATRAACSLFSSSQRNSSRSSGLGHRL